MRVKEKAVLWFHEIPKQESTYVGSKGASLGELTRMGVRVPPGFVVTSHAYETFLESAHLGDVIRRLLDRLHVDDEDKLQNGANRIQKLITNAEVPPEIAQALTEAYRRLGSPLVAVRSSATGPDRLAASFGGQHSTFLNVLGERDVLLALQHCWASLFEPSAIFYRSHQHYDHLSVSIAVPVQRMVQSESSGVMFTAEPISGDPTKIVIEAILGLGEAFVSGAVTPDLYMLDKASRTIVDRRVAPQGWKLMRNPNGKDLWEANHRVPVPESDQTRQKLNDEQLRELASIGLQIEAHQKGFQEIEWAKEGDEFSILQTHPITTREVEDGVALVHRGEIVGKLLLSGLPASPGVRSGLVRVLSDASQIEAVEQGEVLVTPNTTPDFVPAMKKAVAIVTDQGGRTSHAAIMSQELGIPCVVNTESGTIVLKNHQRVTVDGTWGKVLEGVVELKTARALKPRRPRGVTQ